VRKLSRGFGLLPNKQICPAGYMGGQIYGKEYSFPMLAPKLIFFFDSLIRSFPFRRWCCIPDKRRGIRNVEGKGREGVFSISLFICIGFSDVGLADVGKSNIG